MYTVELEGGEELVAREKAWKKSQASSPRVNTQRVSRTFIYRGRLDLHTEAATDHCAGRQDRMQRGAAIGLAAEGNTHAHSHTLPHTPGVPTFLPMCALTHSHTHAGSKLRKWASVLEVQAPTATPLHEAFLQTLPRDPGCVTNDQHLVAYKVSGVGCFLARPRWPQALGGEQGSHRSRRAQDGGTES